MNGGGSRTPEGQVQVDELLATSEPLFFALFDACDSYPERIASFERARAEAVEHIRDEWRDCLAHYRFLLVACEEMAFLSVAALPGSPRRHLGLRVLVERVLGVGHEVVDLMAAGHAQAAMARARTLHELNVTATLVAQDEAVAERYVEWSTVEVLKDVQSLRTQYPTVAVESLDTSLAIAIDAVEQRKRRFEDPHFDKTGAWARPVLSAEYRRGAVPFHALEAQAGLSGRHFEYVQGCHPVHAGARAFTLAAAGGRNAPAALRGWPAHMRRHGFAVPAQISMEAVLDVTSLLVDASVVSTTTREQFDTVASTFSALVGAFLDNDERLRSEG